ncbi:MAG: hypothetical protein HOA08_23310 [Rhodospirillaceae bacterium]|jgi:hypothetical protein|nr:hypothetical protein [Rhodospirillaceae bacterium]MBT3494495.1 hypothetical protein [Rhodospirillaceae bacterium]MBT3781647.1 hypothetical protein [Rhodospirillaceae bacterium]MBT3977572.1 hypothetical protein [Rhodospirillaceae bacterium]MBT4166612.1 hypothetical protein [Rhodospirillaceae bacterium]
MSVDYQEDYSEDWDMADAMPDMHVENDAASYSNLNEALDEAGTAIGEMSANLPIAFRFDWHGMAIFCQIVERGSEIFLELATDLGPLPFTIENRERRSFLKQLHGLSREIPVGQYVVTERGRFRHWAEHQLEAPITGSSIVTKVVQTILSSRPYYQLAKTPV